MPSVNKEEFNNLVLTDDEREARVINDFYDGPEARKLSGPDRLEQAINQAHEHLTPDLPAYARGFDYQVGRDALRWLGYRDTRLLAATNDGYDHVYSGMLRDRQAEQDEASNFLKVSDPFYFGFYAKLEAIRARRESSGQIMNMPFELEDDYALTVLMNSMDHILRSPQTVCLDNISAFQTTSDVGPESPDYSIIRKFAGPKTAYTLSLYDLEGGPDNNPALGGSGRKPEITYILTESPEGLFTECETRNYPGLFPMSKRRLAENACALIRQMSGGHYTFERPGSPIPELAELSELKTTV